MQSLIRSKSAGVTGGRGTAGAGPGRDLLYWRASCFLLCPLCCSRYEPCEVKRDPNPFLVELPLTTWMDECADQMVCPTLTEIKDEAIAMAEKKTSVQNAALPCKFGKTWWKLFKCRNSDFVSRLAQNVKSQRASARLSPQQWTEFFNNHLKPLLEKVAYKRLPHLEPG